MKRRNLAALALLVGAPLFLLACNRGLASSQAAKGVTPTQSARTDFELASLDGRRLGPKDFAGNVVLVDFWATWCGPCQVQSQILESLHPEYSGKKVQFLAVDTGETADAVRDFLKNKPMPYPVLVDPDQSVSDGLGGRIPASK